MSPLEREKIVSGVPYGRRLLSSVHFSIFSSASENECNLPLKLHIRLPKEGQKLRDQPLIWLKSGVGGISETATVLAKVRRFSSDVVGRILAGLIFSSGILLSVRTSMCYHFLVPFHLPLFPAAGTQDTVAFNPITKRGSSFFLVCLATFSIIRNCWLRPCR